MEQDQPLSHSSLDKNRLNTRPPQRNQMRKNQRYTRRQQPSNTSYFSRNPQIFTALVEDASNSQRSLGSKILILSPAFAFQFCVVLTSAFSVVNLRLLSLPPEYSSVHLIVSSVISIALILVFQKCSQNWIGGRTNLTRLLIGFTVYLLFGTLLVLIANVERLFHADSRNLNVSGNATFSFSDQTKADQMQVGQVILHDESYIDKSVYVNVTEKSTEMLLNAASRINLEVELTTASMSDNKMMSTSSLHAQILSFVGYSIMSSAFSSGQLLMSNVGASLTGTDKQARVGTIVVVVAAFGGCCTSFLGTLDLSSISNQANENSYILVCQIVILLSITMALLIGCTVCSLITWYSDVIMAAMRPEEDIEENILIGYDRRPTRTAQEIYDECAALLGRRISISYMEDNLSPRNLPTEYEESVSNSMCQSETAADDSTRHDRRLEISNAEISQPPIIIKNTTETKSCMSIMKTRSFCLIVILMFLLSSGVVSVEYNSAVYLGHVFEHPVDTFKDGSRKGSRIASAGIFMLYLVFALVKSFFEDTSQKLGWKSLYLGVSLVSTLTTLAFAISDEVAVYFTASCVLGLLRLAVIGLPWAAPKIPTTILWCMMPLSLGVSSALLLPLVDVSSYHGAAMYYSASCSLLGCLVMLALC